MDSEDFQGTLDDPRKARRRIMAQGVNILHSLVEAYQSGALDDPNVSANLCTMFALIAEGKVTGHFDDDTGKTKWSLTENYMKRLQEVEDMIMGSKIIKGPWEKTIDTEPNT